MISSGGFPFDIGDEDTAKKSKQQAKNDAIFPCDVGIGWSLACSVLSRSVICDVRQGRLD